MFAHSTLFELWSEIIDRISVSAEIAPKNIRLADKSSIFGWNSAEPQKIGGGAAHDIKFRRDGWLRRRRGLLHDKMHCIIFL